MLNQSIVDRIQWERLDDIFLILVGAFLVLILAIFKLSDAAVDLALILGGALAAMLKAGNGSKQNVK